MTLPARPTQSAPCVSGFQAAVGHLLCVRIAGILLYSDRGYLPIGRSVGRSNQS